MPKEIFNGCTMGNIRRLKFNWAAKTAHKCFRNISYALESLKKPHIFTSCMIHLDATTGSHLFIYLLYFGGNVGLFLCSALLFSERSFL